MDDFYIHHLPQQEFDPTDNWIEIERNKGPEAWWLHEALRDNGIPFVADAETFPGNNIIYNVVYIPPEYEEQALALIEAFNNPENFVLDEYPEVADMCSEDFSAEDGVFEM